MATIITMSETPGQVRIACPTSSRGLFITACEPDRRFHSMSDVGQLQEIREGLDPIRKEAIAARARNLRWIVPILVIIIALALVTRWWLLRRPAHDLPAVLTAVPLTTYPGQESRPAFSPDGNQLAFNWNGEKEDNWDIYIKTVMPGEACLTSLTWHCVATRSPTANPLWKITRGGVSVCADSPHGGWAKVYRNQFSGKGD
jgi:hypothetical protein